MSTTAKTRSKPRISIAKLGEYMTATPRRRRAIIRAQHRPQDAIVARYHDARLLISRFLIGELDEDELIRQKDELAGTTSGSEWVTEDRRLSVLAIDRFLEVADQVRIQGILRPGTEVPGSIRCGGIDVSVRPDVVMAEDSTGRVASIKLVFAKSVPVTAEASAYIATGLAEHLLRRFPEGKVAREWCQVIDVMHGVVMNGPRTHRNRVADIEAACEEIAGAWDRASR